jgi:hypothetical protein
MNPSNLFGLSDHLEARSKHGDPLEVLDGVVDFEYFRAGLSRVSVMAIAANGAARRLIRLRCSRR